MDREILQILSQNSRLTNEQIAVMLGRKEEEVARAIEEMEDKNIILGYPALIDWEKTDNDTVSAYIEVKVTPQRDRGFDDVAERIYQFSQVKSCSLMSGSYDLFVVVEGKSMKDVALFVAEKLATIDSVLSTSTHFVLKKYKDKGVIFNQKRKDNREAVVL
ncbi:MAG: Lrp/AsnC family transcriptional regulator [Clostridiaceae bacterium]|jgi:DNA-binding Lrp family transcriptional regulator|nr:Lrp/AsnC family transcriptional regulator [Clostridiaceae bacterium]